jgi:hypothetical protein
MFEMMYQHLLRVGASQLGHEWPESMPKHPTGAHSHN